MSVNDYPAGKKFRVVKDGARLHGWKRSGPYSHTGTQIDLKVGDVIESKGYSAGMGSDPGYGVHFKGDAAYLQFTPSQGGIFAYHPADGYLEPVEDE